MSGLGAQDIAIGRLRVRGDVHAARRLARELEQESWPLHLPANLRNAWIFVRELQVHGSQRQLRQQTAQQLVALISHAVDGHHASASATVVCFSSLPELLAFLLSDLARGQAAGKWYWQRWSYLLRTSREQAIAELLCENLAELPAVVEHLATLGQLARVWQFVPAATADTIVRQLASYHHIPLAPLSAVIDGPEDRPILQTAARQFQWRKTWLQLWRPLMMNIERTDCRWVLAALISGIAHCPLLIVRSPSALVRAFIAQFDEFPVTQGRAARHGPAAADSSQYPLTSLVEARLPDEDLPEASAGHEDTSIPKSRGVDRGQNIPPTTTRHQTSSFNEMAVETAVSARPVAVSLQDSLTVLHPGVNRQITSVAEQAPMPASPDPIQLPAPIEQLNTRFMTRMGGIFYLVNALGAVLTPAFLAGQPLASGWPWLLDCGRLWAGKLGLELDQPLLRFIASTLGDDDYYQALAAQPISAESQALFSQLEQGLGGQAFWLDAGALANPAEVRADASHIDVFYALDSVRLDIRLAGLDVNPGWVPWLGRVVAFHYIESMPLEADRHAD